MNEARAASEAGAQVIIARGYQAKLIKEYTDIPIIEVRFTAQEIGILLRRAQKMILKDNLHVAIIAFENMLPDMRHMEELFGVRLTTRMLDEITQAGQVLHELSRQDQKPDIIIGGKAVCETARIHGYPSIYYESTEECITEAVRRAKSSLFAMDIEKRNAAQLETLIDMSDSGIIHVGLDGNILAANTLVETLSGMTVVEMTGKPFQAIFPQIDFSLVTQVLEGKRESLATSVNIRNRAWMLLMASMEYDRRITGAVLSLRSVKEIHGITERMESKMVRYGFQTNITFRDIKTENQDMKEMLRDAETFALSDSPVLIYAPTGSRDSALAKAIHNNSARRDGPFVSINVGDMEKDNQLPELFRRGDEVSDKGAMIKADHGTLYIRGVEKLTLQCQNQILRTLLPWKEMRTDARSFDTLDVRLIVSSGTNLKLCVESGSFSPELYYRINGLVLNLPPLHQRQEDLIREFREEIKYHARKINRRFQITEGGCKKIVELEWPGNEAQLHTFCERLVLSAKKRMIDEVAIQKIYSILYPEVLRVKNEDRLVVYDSPEGLKIRELLIKYGGNRAQVAKELGISTTTLWRHMKKYGIEANFHLIDE